MDNQDLMRVVDLRGVAHPAEHPLARADMDVDEAAAAVSDVVADVRVRGAQAVVEAGERFDGVRAPQLRVPKEVLTAALHALDQDLHDALVTAIGRVRAVTEAQLPDSFVVEVTEGGTVTQRWIPVDRVGLYVPGGRAVYPSSVIMNVVPAQIAGVESLAVASPPQLDNGGWPHPVIMAACALLDIDEVYAAGGAQAVAMFAYGVELPDGHSCDPVAMVTGPGNIYVTAAKRLLRGRIGIDSEAGPTEIMVVADASADPAFVAADLISQAEHDVVAASVLVTDAPELAAQVQAQVVKQVAETKHSDRIRQALSGPQSAIVLVDDIDAAMAVSDAYAAEHLEIHTFDARARAMGVRNAGAVFVGPYTPVSLGDYAAGSNHVLPTGGCACHSAGLSVQTFLRGVQVVEYDEPALAAIAETVTTLAAAEDLPAHGAAITARTKR